MRPILFTLGSFSFRANLVAVGIAFFLGSYIASYEAKRKDIDPRLIKDFTYQALIIGLVTGRLSYVIFSGYFTYYVKNPIRLIPSLETGSTFYGLIGGVVLASWLYSNKHRLSIFQFLDTITPGYRVAILSSWQMFSSSW